MNEAIQAMLATPGTHYVTDPSQLAPGPNGEPAKQLCMPVWVDDYGDAYQLGKGNQRGAKIDPTVFREDAIVLKERPKYRKLVS